MADTKSSSSFSYRLSDETRNKISDIQKTAKISADALFREFISAYEHENFSSTSYGAAMQNDLDAWAMHSAAIQQLYTNAIRAGIDAKEIATKELLGRIEASESALSGLREKLNNAESAKKDMTDQLNATKKSLQEALNALEKAENESEQARENAEAWKNSINTLTAQLKEYQNKVQNYDQLSEKLAKSEADLLAAQASNKVLTDLIDKYMSK